MGVSWFVIPFFVFRFTRVYLTSSELSLVDGIIALVIIEKGQANLPHSMVWPSNHTLG